MSARVVGPGRQVRRPVRGGHVLEFLVGIFAGVLASFVLSFGMQLSSLYPGSTVSKRIEPSTGTAATTTAAGASGISSTISPVETQNDDNGGEWKPKPRLATDRTPKIVCAVTQNLQYETVPGVLNATWGSRCDRLVFAAPRINGNSLAGFETVPVEKMGDKDTNWQTLRSLLNNLVLKDEDFVFVVDDLTYAIPDNVRYEFRGPNPGEQALFWGRKDTRNFCKTQAFVLSRVTFQALQAKLRANDPVCDKSSNDAQAKLSKCLASIQVSCTEAKDFQGKLQFMDDPVKLLSVGDKPAHMREDPECCSVLPVVFFDVGKMHSIRTGVFSYQYFYDYFIRDTAVYGREHMRPLNGIDAGVGKKQVGF